MAQDAGAAVAVRRLDEERYGAMIAADLAGLDRLLDPDLVYTHSTGDADTKASYLDSLRSGVWKYRGITRSDESVVVREGAVLVFNRVRIDILIRGTPKLLDNRMLAVWVPSPDGAWRLLAVHSTPSPRSAAA